MSQFKQVGPGIYKTLTFGKTQVSVRIGTFRQKWRRRVRVNGRKISLVVK